MDQDATLNEAQVAKKEKSISPAVVELNKKLEAISSSEQKIRAYLEFMKATLTERPPRFKDYWEVKKLCLPLFKESLSAQSRSELWNHYIELSTEARLLKTALDEQSTFAMEQIDLAIQAVEADLEKLEEILTQTSELYFPEDCHFLAEKKGVYLKLQKELNLLNNLAARVTSLRKEMIKTEMRIRFKNKLFDRLSLAGDRIFPRRKELIQQISSEFLNDIMEFSKEGFSEESLHQHGVFGLRDEIKALQNVAKELTLDTQTFTQTRLELSRLWDILKDKDKERKKEFAEKREAHQKNVALVMDKIKPFGERCAQETFTPEEASKQAGEILNFMKTVELGRDEVHFLKDEISKARLPITERAAKEQAAREKEVEISQRQRHEKIEQFKARLKEVSEKIAETAIEELLQTREKFKQELNLLKLSYAEKELLEHELKTLRDLILDKKEKTISSLTPQQKQSLDHLYEVVEEWKQQKNEVREQLEVYRTALAGSGFDIEKAMRHRELMDNEKKRLDKINASIEELEKQIEGLEGE
jgi:hypothetical protein